MPENQYPEHSKLHKVKHLSQTCHDFLEWLEQKKGFHLGHFHRHTPECPGWDDQRHRINKRGILTECCEYVEDRLYPAQYDDTKLLAEFFEIDLKKLEAEKRAILKECRAEHGQ